MALGQQRLPYEILETACELYGGKTGFTQKQMKDFFAEEIRKVTSPSALFDENTFLGRLANALDQMGDLRKLRPDPFPTNEKAFEYWLSLLPLWRQRELRRH